MENRKHSHFGKQPPQEISRTGRDISSRDVESMARSARDGDEPLTDTELLPGRDEERDEAGQNAIGGRPSRKTSPEIGRGRPGVSPGT